MVYARVVSVLSNSGTGTQDITFTGGTSFTPKLAIFQWSRANTSSDTFQEHMSTGYGFTDGTNQRCIAVSSEDNQARSDTASIQRDDAVICTLNPTGTVAGVDALATFSSWLTDGIQINWTDAPAAQFYLTVTLIGGNDLTNIDIGTILTTTGGSASLSSLSWQPENGIFLAASGTTTENSPVSHAIMCLGAYDGTTQWTQGYLAQDNPVTMITRQNYQHNRVMDIPTTAGATNGYSTIAWTSNGFTLTNTDTYSASLPIYYCVWKGGTCVTGYATEPGSVSQQTITTNEDVQAVMVFGVDSGTAGWQNGAMWTSGMATSTTERYVDVFEDTNGVADSIVVSRHDTDQLYLNITSNATASSSTLDDEATFYSKSSTNVVLNWTNIGQARPFRYITLGGIPPTQVSTTKTHKYNIVSKVTQSKTHKYNIISKVTQSKTHKYNIVTKVTATRTHKYNVTGGLTQVSTTKTHKYNVSEYTPSVLICSAVGGVPTGGTYRAPLFSSYGAGWTTTAYSTKTWRSTGILSRLSGYVGTNTAGGTSTARIYINAVASNQVISWSAGATGRVEDTTNTDTITDGQTVNIGLVTGTSGTTYFDSIQVCYTLTTNTDTVPRTVHPVAVYGRNQTTAVDTSFYQNLSGSTGDYSTTDEAQAQVKFKRSCTVKNLRVHILTNTPTTNSTFRVRKNGSDTNLSISTSATGDFEDTDSDTISVNDLVNYAVTTGSGAGTTDYFFVGANIEHSQEYDSAGSQELICGDIGAGFTATGNYYVHPSALFAGNTNDVLAVYYKNYLDDRKLSSLTVRINSNTQDGTVTIRPRKNQTTDLDPVISIPSGTTGHLENNTDWSILSVNDTFTYHYYSASTTGTLGWSNAYIVLSKPQVKVSKTHIYDVALTPVSTTKTHKYNITSEVTASRTHKYNISSKVTATRTHKYNVSTEVETTKTHKYNILSKVTQSKTHKYNISNAVSTSKTHKYNIVNKVTATKTHLYIVANAVSTTKTHKFSILNRIDTIKTHVYSILNKITATKTHKYNILNKISTTKTHKYNVLQAQEQVVATKTHKYHIAGKVTSSHIHKYHIEGKITASKTHIFSILNKISTTKTHLYNLVTRVAPSKTHKFNILERIQVSKSHLYHIEGKVTTSKTHIYGVLNSIATTKTHLYGILNAVSTSKTHLYSILQQISLSKTHKFNVEGGLTQVSTIKTHKFSILNKISVTKSHLYGILEKITASRTHKFNISLRITPDASKTHKFNIKSKVTASKTHKFNIISRITRTHTHRWNSGGKVLVTKRHNYNIGIAYVPPVGAGSASTLISVKFPERIRIIDIISNIENKAIANIQLFESDKIICRAIVELTDPIFPITRIASGGKARHRTSSRLIIPQVLDTIENHAVSDRIGIEELPLPTKPEVTLQSQIQLSPKQTISLLSQTQIKEDNSKLLRLSATTEIVPCQRVASMASLELSVLNDIKLKAPEIMSREREQTIKNIITLLNNNELFK